MSRNGEGGRLKKNNCCLTCSIISSVVFVIFIAALFIGGNIMFKKYVSPKIGGVGLTDSLSLAGKLLVGKQTKASYSEDDLDDFYDGLSSSLFLSDKSNDELQYDLVPEDEKAVLAATGSPSAAIEESVYGPLAYDNDAAYAAFLRLTEDERYNILSDKMRSICSREDFGRLDKDECEDLRKRIGLKTYRLSIENILGEDGFSQSKVSSEKMAERAFSALDFNFETLADYDIDDPSAPENTQFTTFSVSGNQVSAFINDILTYFLSSDDSSMNEQFKSFLPKDKNLGDYVKIASVTIKNAPLAIKGNEALFNQKDTELGITVSISLRELVKTMMSSDDVKKRLQSMPEFAVKMVPNMVPKYLSVSAFVYPLADDADKREVSVKVNKMTDKNAKSLSRIVNGLMNKSSSEETAEKNFFGELNEKVVKVFKSINDKVKINFIPSLNEKGEPIKDKSGKTLSELQIMTIETLLSMMDNSDNLSTHEIFTVLKCLYVTENKPAALNTDASLSAFKTEISSKYGVDISFLNEKNLLSSGAFDDLINHIHLADGGLDFSLSNDKMQVQLSAEALAALMMDILSKGDSGVAAAEGEGASDILKNLSPEICSITVDKVSEKEGKKVYSLELVFSVSLSDLVSGMAKGDDTTTKLAEKLMPKGKSYFGIKLFVSEEREDGKLVHKAGKNIDKDSSAYETSIRINDFSYAQTASVIETIDKFMKTIGSAEFNMSEITGSVEDVITDLFHSLQNGEFNLEIRFFEKTADSKGGIMLPSIYEVVESLVAPRLGEEESFTASDAQQILRLVYQKEFDKTVSFKDSQADDLLSKVNDKFYISYESRLAASDLFGDGASHLSDKITADSLYFKPSLEEENKWGDAVEKPALFTDDRAIEDLRVSLTGSELAALIKTCDLLPDDLSSSFGELTVLGASFQTKEGKTYLNFDVLCALTKGSGSKGEKDQKDLSVLFPESIKISFEVLMYADSYTAAKRFSSTIKINEEETAKIFTLLKAFGGESLDPSSLSDKIEEALAPVFGELEKKIPVYYSNAGASYTTTVSGKTENCVYLADVFTALIGITEIKDSINEDTGAEIPEEDRTLSSPQAFRNKLQEFGRMPAYSFEGESKKWSVDVSGVSDFFTETDLNAFLASVKSNYYLTGDLTAENIMGDGADFDVNASSVSFPSLYADERSVENLSVALNGKALGALVKQTLGEIALGEEANATLIQSAFRIDTKGTLDRADDSGYLDLALLVLLTGDSSLLPSHIVVQAVIDLGYDFEKGCFPDDFTCSATVTVNDMTLNQTKNMFGYISVLGGDFSIDTVTQNISDSIRDGIKDMLALYPKGTVVFENNAIILPDVYTFLIEKTEMSDTTAQQLANRLRGFGYQLNANGDPNNEGSYDWVSGLKLFESTDDDYVYTNMQKAYFMKDKPTMDGIYDGVKDLFGTIDKDKFNLADEGGLYYYSGDIKTLKISDKALGVMIQTKSNESFASSVSGGDITVDIESVKIDPDGLALRLESGVKIAFGSSEIYSMLPKYFFVKALTQENGLGGYTTQIVINNLSRAETVAFFTNFSSLGTIGVKTDAFDLETIETEINKAITGALESFTKAKVTYGTFTQSDLDNEYNETNYAEDSINLAVGDGYIQVPSIYSFMIDLFYTSDKPTEASMQHMINKIYESESTLNSNIVKNAASSTSFNKTGVYRGSTAIYDAVAIYSDRYLASFISDELKDNTINDDIEIKEINQMIIMRSGDDSKYDDWRSKFFPTSGDFNSSHTYVIVTAVADLSEYSSGSADLLPEELWFSVLIDIDDKTLSRGLLYDMNGSDMSIFEHILSSNNAKFNINAIAIELAGLISGQIDSFKTGLLGKITYYADADDFYYAESAASFDSNKTNVADDENMNGVGYIVVSVN